MGWDGRVVSGNINVVNLDDAQIDAALNALCSQVAAAGETLRAAETSEIEQVTIEGAPFKNPAAVPLMGTCPNCRGDPDDPSEGVTHKSGFARVCWDPNVDLTEANRRTDCGSGKKAVLCVNANWQDEQVDFYATRLSCVRSQSCTKCSLVS